MARQVELETVNVQADLIEIAYGPVSSLKFSRTSGLKTVIFGQTSSIRIVNVQTDLIKMVCGLVRPLARQVYNNTHKLYNITDTYSGK